MLLQSRFPVYYVYLASLKFIIRLSLDHYSHRVFPFTSLFQERDSEPSFSGKSAAGASRGRTYVLGAVSACVDGTSVSTTGVCLIAH